MRRPSALLCALAVALTVLAPGSASAQTGGDDDEALARELFRSGLAAAEEGRWNEARVDFERAYALVPRSSILLNLAAAQAEVGRLVEAAVSYRGFLASASGRDARFRSQAEQSLAEVEARIARVTIEIADLQPGDTLEVDGQVTATDGLGAPMSMDPGEHRLVVRRGAQEIGRLELVLVEGEARGVSMPLRAVAPPAAPDSPAEPPPGEDPVASPWLWVGVGGGVVVALALIIGIAVGVSSGEGHFVGTLGPGMVTFE